MKVDNIRREYDRQLESLDLQQQLPKIPHQLFLNWFQTAIDSKELIDPTAMLLATSYQEQISQRIVLLKDATEAGYIFYTNYQSQKAQALLAQPSCNLHFAWLPLERQISISGRAEKVAPAVSDAYFASRPRASQLAAWASEQSQPVRSRSALDEKFAAVEERFKNEPNIPRPQHWGGFIVKPNKYEFWQGAEARLHDRFVYQLQAKGHWQLQRLQP